MSEKDWRYNRLKVSFGEIYYYSAITKSSDFTILYIHGLADNSDWFQQQYEPYHLGKFSWIIPDLIGFGLSSRPDELEAYTMENQAQYLLSILIKEKVKSLVIFGHSMGGAIAIYLVELLAQELKHRIDLLGLFYLEGNLDENDTFYSSKIAGLPFEKYRKKTIKKNAFRTWASSVNLVKVSKTEILLPKLIKYLHFPVYFVFGEKNKGRFTSEALIKRSKLPLVYIPDAGHFLQVVNPASFWRIITDLLLTLKP